MRDRISQRLKKSVNTVLPWGSMLVLACIIGCGPLAGQSAPKPSTASQRALLDQYCVICHNDTRKVDNLKEKKSMLWEITRKYGKGLSVSCVPE